MSWLVKHQKGGVAFSVLIYKRTPVSFLDKQAGSWKPAKQTCPTTWTDYKGVTHTLKTETQIRWRRWVLEFKRNYPVTLTEANQWHSQDHLYNSRAV